MLPEADKEGYDTPPHQCFREVGGLDIYGNYIYISAYYSTQVLPLTINPTFNTFLI